MSSNYLRERYSSVMLARLKLLAPLRRCCKLKKLPEFTPDTYKIDKTNDTV